MTLSKQRKMPARLIHATKYFDKVSSKEVFSSCMWSVGHSVIEKYSPRNIYSIRNINSLRNIYSLWNIFPQGTSNPKVTFVHQRKFSIKICPTAKI